MFVNALKNMVGQRVRICTFEATNNGVIEEVSDDPYSRALFQMASWVPENMQETACQKAEREDIVPVKGMLVNGKVADMLDLMIWGTQVARQDVASETD